MNDVFSSSTASSSITSNYTTKDKYRKVFIIIIKNGDRERRKENGKLLAIDNRRN